MSRTPEEEVAYALGVEEGTERGTILGRTQAWLEVQAWAIEVERSVVPYTDTRHLSALLDLANGKLLLIGSGSPESWFPTREEAGDGTESG